MKLIWYKFLRWYIRWALKIYYKNHRVRHREMIPRKGGVLFCPNHQNAFMDALLIAGGTRRILHFLMRADLFNQPLANKVLRFMNMRPIFRQRDGKDSLEKNNYVFAECVEVLGADGSYAIFPEGTHDRRRFLRRVKKGPARIALMAADQGVNPHGIWIIPAAMNFSAHKEFRSDVYLIYGKPIRVEDFLPLYRQNEAQGLKALSDRIREGIEADMIHISKHEERDLIEFAREHCSGNETGEKKLRKGQKVVQNTETALEEDPKTIEKVRALKKEMEIKKLKPGRSLQAPSVLNLLLKGLLLLPWTPFMLLGLAANAIGILLVRYLWDKKISDNHWNTSIAFSVGLFGFPLFHLLQCLLIWLFNGSAWLGLIAFPGSWILGYLAIFVFEGWQDLWYRFKLHQVWQQAPKGMEDLQRHSRQIKAKLLA